MAKKKRPNYSIGYKKPPSHTQFKPGQSGNLKGRPKKTDGLEDVLWKELRKRISVTKDGKRQTVSMIELIVKQCLNKAASGDTRAGALVFNLLRFHQNDDGDKLRALVQEFRTVHARHLASPEDGVRDIDG